MNCKECGAEIPDGSSVCDSCGASQSSFRLKVDKPEPKKENEENAENGERLYTVNYPEHRTQSQPASMSYEQQILQYREPLNKKKSGIASDADVPSIVVAIALAVGAFLPYASAFGFNVTAWDCDWGRWFVLFAVIAGVCAFLDISIGVIAVGAVSMFLALYEAVQNFSGTYGLLQKGLGFYVLLIASFGLLATGFLRKNKL